MLQLEQSLGYTPRQRTFEVSMYWLERDVSAFYTGEPCRPTAGRFESGRGSSGSGGSLLSPAELEIQRCLASPMATPTSEQMKRIIDDSVSWIRSTDYIKDIVQGQLHVHAPEGIVTGANLNGRPISNYEAAMLDLQKGKVRKNTGNF